MTWPYWIGGIIVFFLQAYGWMRLGCKIGVALEIEHMLEEKEMGFDGVDGLTRYKERLLKERKAKV